MSALLSPEYSSEYVQSDLPVSEESRLGKIQYIISSKADTFNFAVFGNDLMKAIIKHAGSPISAWVDGR